MISTEPSPVTTAAVSSPALGPHQPWALSSPGPSPALAPHQPWAPTSHGPSPLGPHQPWALLATQRLAGSEYLA